MEAITGLFGSIVSGVGSAVSYVTNVFSGSSTALGGAQAAATGGGLLSTVGNFSSFVLPLVGAAFSASGQTQALQAKSQASSFNARQDEQNAIRSQQDIDLARETTAVNQSIMRRNAARRLGSLRAKIGGSGFRFSGSKEALYQDEELELEQDILLQKHSDLLGIQNLQREKQDFQASAALNRSQSKSFKKAKTSAAVNPFIKNIPSALSGASLFF